MIDEENPPFPTTRLQIPNSMTQPPRAWLHHLLMYQQRWTRKKRPEWKAQRRRTGGRGGNSTGSGGDTRRHGSLKGITMFATALSKKKEKKKRKFATANVNPCVCRRSVTALQEESLAAFTFCSPWIFVPIVFLAHPLLPVNAFERSEPIYEQPFSWRVAVSKEMHACANLHRTRTLHFP